MTVVMARIIFASLLIAFVLSMILNHVDAACRDQNTCDSCTGYGQSCRWCPLDRKCHKKGSGVVPGFGDNPCTQSMNIIVPSGCSSLPQSYGVFDPDLSYQLAVVSSVTYYDQPDKCLNYAKTDLHIDGEFEVLDMFKRKCDDYIFDYKQCAAALSISHKMKLTVLSYRGTTQKVQLLDEIVTVLSLPKSPIQDGSKAEVQDYFLNAYTSLSCAIAEFKKVMKQYPDYKVAVTGHSLGGAIASIAAYKLVSDGVVPSDKLSIYTYGSPRVGNKFYAEHFDKTVNNSWRVVHYKDCVTHYPTCIGSCVAQPGFGPYHHRNEVFFDSANMYYYSNYTVCHSDEDAKCSHKYQGLVKTLYNSGHCGKNHENYYGIKIGDYCKNNARFMPANDKVEIDDDKCHTYVRNKKGEWVDKNCAASNQGTFLVLATLYMLPFVG